MKRIEHRGVAIVEVVIALPILLVVILAAIQFGLIYQAKATLNHASLQAARAGAVEHANPDAIRRGLARGLVPLYSPDSSLSDVIATLARINAELASDARIRILNPTREAFADFGEEVNGAREIPNDRLHARSTTVGAQSGVNIQDANILRIEITYGYELKVPLVNWFISRTLLGFRGARAADAFQQQLLRRTRLPVIATATVRMQSPARESGLVVALTDLPEVQRFDASSRPPDDEEEDEEDEEGDGGDTGAGSDDDGSSLADGFLGFGGGAGDGGGGSTPGSGGGSGGGGSGGGGNNGNPRQCDIDRPEPSPFPPSIPPPGDSSPVTPAPGDPFGDLRALEVSSGLRGGATLPGIDLPSLGVGNPIHVATGNKYQREPDLAFGGALGLIFERHYNSDTATRAGAIGAKWRHSFQAELHAGEHAAHDDMSAANVLYLTQADGRVLRFTRSETDRTRYEAQRAGEGEVLKRSLPNDCAGGSGSAQICAELVWRWRTGRELLFNAHGRLLSIRNGVDALTLHYNAASQLMHVSDLRGRALYFDYYPNARLKRVRGLNTSVRYRYDGAGNLEYAISSDGRARRYHYEDARHPYHLTGVSLGSAQPAPYGDRRDLMRVARWAYDEQGRGVLSTHADDAGKVTLSYGADYTDVADAFNRVSRYAIEWRDGISLVTEVRGPGCAACGVGDVSYEYNEHAQLTRIAAKHEPSLHYEYDAQRRLLNASREIDGRVESLARYYYEGDKHAPSRVERPSVNPTGVRAIHVEYRDDGAPEVVRELGYAPSAAGFVGIERRYTLSYDAHRRLRALDGPRTDVADVTRFEYDDAERRIAVIDPDGVEQRVLAFDAADRPTRLQTTGSPVIELAYDAAGRITARSELRGAGVRSHHYRYDALGRLHEVEGPDGHIERIDYDSAQRPQRHSIETGLTQAFAFAPDGQIVASALTRRDGGVLRRLQFAYDEQRRLIEIRDGDGPPLQQLLHDDEDARVDRAIDPLGLVTAFDYDALGRLAAITAADGGRTRFEHDVAGRLAQLIAPNDARTRYAYDDFGRRVREDSGDRGVTRYAYDTADNLVEKVDARGEALRFRYSAAGRLASLTSSESATTFEYAHGRLIRASGPEGEERFDYNDDGDLIEHTRTIGKLEYTTAWRYDAQGRVTLRRLPSGEWLAHEYNDRGALARIARNRVFKDRTLVAARSARKLDALGAVAYGNGLTLETNMDAEGRIHRRALGRVDRAIYRYDEANRIVGIDRNDETTEYEYDAVHRLIAARTKATELRYDYDENGNRRREARTAKFPSPAERGWIKEGASGSRHDAAGNITHRGTYRYEYNALGRPIRLFLDEKLIAEYAYNIWGERTRKTLHDDVRTTTTHYVYEQRRLIAEANERGHITREYIYLEHHPVAMFDEGKPYWIHTDHLGAPFAVSDADQRGVWQAEYEPFGLASVQNDPDRDGHTFVLNLRFPGQYADAESGTHYNLMRDYDPTTGRYLTPDPLGIFDGLNTYAYAHSNPVNRFDSLGLYDEMIHYYMTYFLGIVAGLPQDIARTIAIASQYIDENPLTMPTREFLFLTYGANHPALPLYHFVLNDQGPLYGDRTDDWLRRFYGPQSTQLNNLFNSTDPQRLMELWRQAHPDENACPAPWVINDARYQLFGEYLHAYEDTFAHRDRLNTPYGVRPNTENDPYAYYGGHVGLGSANPLDYEPPDETFNQDYEDDESECVIGDSVRTRRVVFDLSADECRRAGGQFTEHQTNAWESNELRTLRMQHEVFGLLQQNFAEEIERNRERYGEAGQELPSRTWTDLAGRAWDSRDPERNARIGLRQDYDEWRRWQGYSEIETVLQRFNASSDDEEDRVDILNEWLEDNGFVDLSGNDIALDLWDRVNGSAASDRWNNIGWLPRGSFRGLLLPRDEPCQQIRNIPGDCDERPRR